MKLPDHSSWLSTNTGKVIDLLDPDPDQFTIEDIANNLSRICRFNGQIKQFYSVAQHSIWVSKMCPDPYKLVGLLHDASEAYICDVPTPFKRMLGDAYKDVETRIMRAIGQKFGVDLATLPPCVKQADAVMLMTERDRLQATLIPWGEEYDQIVRLPDWSPLGEYDTHIINWFTRTFTDYTGG